MRTSRSTQHGLSAFCWNYTVSYESWGYFLTLPFNFDSRKNETVSDKFVGRCTCTWKVAGSPAGHHLVWISVLCLKRQHPLQVSMGSNVVFQPIRALLIVKGYFPWWNWSQQDFWRERSFLWLCHEKFFFELVSPTPRPVGETTNTNGLWVGPRTGWGTLFSHSFSLLTCWEHAYYSVKCCHVSSQPCVAGIAFASRPGQFVTKRRSNLPAGIVLLWETRAGQIVNYFSFITGGSMGSPGGPPPAPKIFSNSCSFQAILSKFWAQGPPGVKTPLSPPD